MHIVLYVKVIFVAMWRPNLAKWGPLTAHLANDLSGTWEQKRGLGHCVG